MDCHWPFSTLVVLSDLTCVCGCTDTDKSRPVGDLTDRSLSDVWLGPVLTRLREELLCGKAPAFCGDCMLARSPTHSGCKTQLTNILDGPQILQVEPCIVCNLRCPTEHCELNNTAKTRSQALLSYDDFCRIFDEAGPNLEILRLYNYGESFLNPRATDMIAYARSKRPDIYIDSHTNGMVFDTEEKRKMLVDCGLDYLVFSIDGAYQESYQRYRRRGDLDVVLENLTEIVRLRNQAGNTRLRICWRYILFRWNDTDEEMARAVELARSIGVDQFVWHFNSADESIGSKRFKPGTPDHIRIRRSLWSYEGGWPNALNEKIDSRYPCRLLARIQPSLSQFRVGPGEPFGFKVTVTNVGDTLWLSGDTDKRGTVRLGPLIFRAHAGNEPPLKQYRFSFKSDVPPGGSATLPVNLNAPDEPGEYQVRLDLVDEHIDWFVSFGSKVVSIPLLVE